MAKAPKKRKTTRRGKALPARKVITCYFCGHQQEVSGKAMSTTCPGCHKAIRIEDLIIKSYTPVNDLETCGRIIVTKKGRIAAKRVRAGDGIECDGTIHGIVETPGDIEFGPKAEWKGTILKSRKLIIVDGVKLDGHIRVPWNHAEATYDVEARPTTKPATTHPTQSLIETKPSQPAKPSTAPIPETPTIKKKSAPASQTSKKIAKKATGKKTAKKVTKKTAKKVTKKKAKKSSTTRRKKTSGD